MRGYDKATKVKDLSSWFTDILHAKLPRFAPYYLNPTNLTLNDETTSTIRSPEMNSRYPMLSFDYSTNINMITYVLNASGSFYPHGKDILTIITGLVGGKARVIEEIKMKMNAEMNNILTVSITLSVDWCYEDWELNFYDNILYTDLKGKDMRRDVGIVFIVMSRLVAMLYGKHIFTARDAFSDTIKKMPKVDIADFHLVLVGFVEALVGEYNRQTGRHIDSFVLLLDGAHRPYEPEYDDKVTGDLWRVLREALLDPDMLTYTGIKTALVMTALPNYKLVLTSPGQQSRSLVTPTVIDSAEVVTKSWLLHLAPALPPLPPTDIARLELVAATCAQRAYLLRQCGDYIFERINKREGINTILSDNFLSSLASHHSNFQRYDYQDTPSDIQMYHILFQKPLKCDISNINKPYTNHEYVSHYLYHSYFTNTIDSVSPEATIIPDASVIIMTHAVNRSEDEYEHNSMSYKICYKEPLVNIFNTCLNPDSANAEGGGGLLQSIVSNIIKAKISCDLRCIDIPTTITDLLSLSPCNSSDEKATDTGTICNSESMVVSFMRTHRLQSHLPKRVKFPYPDYQAPWCEPPPQVDYTIVTLPRFEQDPEGYYKVMTDSNHLPTAYTPYIFLLPPVSESSTSDSLRGSAYDMVLAVYAGYDEPPYIIFFSLGTTASTATTPPMTETPYKQTGSGTALPQWVIHYRRTFAQLTRVNNLPASGLPLTGLLKHIRDGKWLYVYMSSDPTHTKPIVIDNCLVLSAVEVSRFMGPFREVYKTAVRYVRNNGRD